jgi:hypothetical protein
MIPGSMSAGSSLRAQCQRRTMLLSGTGTGNDEAIPCLRDERASQTTFGRVPLPTNASVSQAERQTTEMDEQQL